jgi:DNA-binding protein HU-beta
MTKAELLERISKSKALPAEMTKKQVALIVDSVFDEITRALKREGKFAYPQFGTFEKKKRAARKGLNPQTGKVIRIPARNTVVFRPTAAFKASLKRRRR